MGKNTKTSTGAALKATPITSKTAAGTSTSDIVREVVKNKDTCETVAINVVQEMLKIQMDTILACFNQVVNNLSSKVDGIMCDVQDLKTSLNYISTDQEEKINNIAGNITLPWINTGCFPPSSPTAHYAEHFEK